VTRVVLRDRCKGGGPFVIREVAKRFRRDFNFELYELPKAHAAAADGADEKDAKANDSGAAGRGAGRGGRGRGRGRGRGAAAAGSGAAAAAAGGGAATRGSRGTCTASLLMHRTRAGLPLWSDCFAVSHCV
jgi:hypothetical protein